MVSNRTAMSYEKHSDRRFCEHECLRRERWYRYTRTLPVTLAAAAAGWQCHVNSKQQVEVHARVLGKGIKGQAGAYKTCDMGSSRAAMSCE